MSQAQLLEIAKELTLLDEDEVNFILAEYLKNKAMEKQKTKTKKVGLPAHIRKGIKESLQDIKEGKYTLINNKLKLTNHLQNLKNQANV